MLQGYISCSLDGFVADAEGGVGFLDPFQNVDYGFEAFFAGIDAVVMGRRTHDDIIGFGVPWPYEGKRADIITSRDLVDPPSGVTRWSGSLAEYARSVADLSTWVVGGARLQSAFLNEGLIGRLDVFVIPVLLGGGVPLFLDGRGPATLSLIETQVYDKGIVRLSYRPEAR